MELPYVSLSRNDESDASGVWFFWCLGNWMGDKSTLCTFPSRSFMRRLSRNPALYAENLESLFQIWISNMKTDVGLFWRARDRKAKRERQKDVNNLSKSFSIFSLRYDDEIVIRNKSIQSVKSSGLVSKSDTPWSTLIDENQEEEITYELDLSQRLFGNCKQSTQE